MGSLSGGCAPSISFTLTGQLGTDPAGQIPEVLNLAGSYSYGTAADQVARIYAATLVLAASTPLTVDLQALTDLAGNPVSFNAVVFLAHRVQSTNNAFVVTVGGAGANEWNGWLTSGSKAIWHPSTAANAGYSIAAAPNTSGMPVSPTSRLLKLDPGANAVGPVDLVIVGR